MKMLLAVIAAWGVVTCGFVSAQDATIKPEELKVLDQYVGHWTSDVINKPAPWDEKGTKFGTINQAEWILNGRMLRHIEVNHVVGDPEKVTKSLFLWTYDPKSAQYVGWTFQSTGLTASSKGQWDSTSKTFTFAPIDPPPKTTGKMTEQFLDANTINGNLTFIADDGTTLMDMVWTRNRQTEDRGKATPAKWMEIGTPIQPLPAELEKLQPLIGEWDSEHVHGPSVVSPERRTSKGQMTANWILDGRFLLFTSETGKLRAISVIGYDTIQKTYRYFSFNSVGLSHESTGQWDEDTQSLVWQPVSERPDTVVTSTTHIAGPDAMQGRILVKNKDGKVHMDLTINSTRQK